MLRLLLLLSALLSDTALGVFDGAQTGFTFMRIGVGARPVAMGGAYTAVADDANALFWNPAGLALAPGLDASVTVMKLLQSVSYMAAGLSAPIGPRFAVGCAGGYLSTSDVRRDELGQEIGAFGLSDLAVGPGLAWQPLRGLGLGAGARYVASRIDSFHASTVSFDGGVLYCPVEYFAAGISLLHVGPPRRFIADWEYPPANLRAGVAARTPFGNNRLILASDISLYPGLSPVLSAGAEFEVRLAGRAVGQTLALRVGYQSGSRLDAWSGFSVGVGYQHALSRRLSLGLDVVYLSYGLLGDSERASLGLHFSPGKTSGVKNR